MNEVCNEFFLSCQKRLRQIRSPKTKIYYRQQYSFHEKNLSKKLRKGQNWEMNFLKRGVNKDRKIYTKQLFKQRGVNRESSMKKISMTAKIFGKL